MRVRPIELDVPHDNPFKNDALNRKELEPPLTEFVTQAIGPFVLALDGSWGSGKTTFLRMWQAKLSQVGHACLYLNAWKSDFTQEPLIAVISELSEAIENFAPAGESGEHIRQYMHEARKIGASIVKRFIPVGLKIVTHGLLDLESGMEKALADYVSDMAIDRIKDYENGKSEIQKFKEKLACLVNAATEINPNISTKVVIILDELDRCRPSYAVQLLERIKHLFDVPGIVFVLGIDRSELIHSVRAIYGSEFNAQGYLRRFIDLDYRLPEPSSGNYCSYLFERYGIENLISKRQIRESYDQQGILKLYLSKLMSASGMSLRDQEQTVARLRVVLQTIPRSNVLFSIPLSILLFLREWNYVMYVSLFSRDIRDPRDTYDTNLLSQIEKITNTPIFDDHERTWIEVYLIAGLIELEIPCSRLDHYQESVDHPGNPEELEKTKKKLSYIAEVRNSRSDRSGFILTQKRLELTNNFILDDDERGPN